MAIFVVTCRHRDSGAGPHMKAHVAWVQRLLEDGHLIAAGPFSRKATRDELLVFSISDRTALDKVLSSDPVAIAGDLEICSVQPWDPIFGALNGHSSMPVSQS